MSEINDNSVHILGRFPPPVDGQTMATRRLARLLENQFRVYIIDFSTGDTEFAESRTQLQLDKVRHYLRCRRTLRETLKSAPDGPLFWASISASTLGHIRDATLILPLLGSLPAVYAVIHWGNFDRLFRSPLTRYTAARLVRKLHGFVFLDRSLAEQCAAWIPDSKRIIIPNTIDEDVQCTDTEIQQKQEDRGHRTRLRLLFLSNMTPSKGYLDVLKAVHRLHEQVRNVQAEFVGRWETEQNAESFRRYVEEHDLREVVIHHGGVRDRQRIKRFYLEADVLLLPTYYPTEAQPLTIIEALNAGTPILTTRHAGIPEMVREGKEAIFVPPKDPEAIAKAMQQLWDYESWLRLSNSARERFNSRFHPDVVGAQWEALASRSL